jgi:hypothetical protein
MKHKASDKPKPFVISTFSRVATHVENSLFFASGFVLLYIRGVCKSLILKALCLTERTDAN